LKLWQHSKGRALPRASARNTGGLERHPPTAPIRLLSSTRGLGRESEPRHPRSRVESGPTVTPGTPSRPDNKLRASTTIVRTARATTTTMDASGATIATMTANVVGHQTSEVRRPLAGASATRSSPRASGLQPMCLSTMGTPTPAYSSRTTGSHATLVERPTTSSSSRTYRSTSVTLRAHCSST
jgi:hypothetical protein